MAGSKEDIEKVEGSEVLDYAQQLENAFYNYCDKYGIQPDRNNPEPPDSFFHDQEALILFRNPDKNAFFKSKIDFYDIETILSIVNKYIQICKLFSILPKVDTIAEVLHFSHSVVYKWKSLNTTSDIIFTIRKEDSSIYDSGIPEKLSLRRVDVVKMISRARQGKVFNVLSTNPQGATVLGNNDNETGLLWEPRNLAYKADLAQEAISTNDIAKKYGINGNNNSLLNG